MNANLQQQSTPSTPPSNNNSSVPDNHNDISNNINSSSNWDDVKSNDDGHNPNPVDFGDLSYLLNKIRPNLMGRDNRPQVNYRVS